VNNPTAIAATTTPPATDPTPPDPPIVQCFSKAGAGRRCDDDATESARALAPGYALEASRACRVPRA